MSFLGEIPTLQAPFKCIRHVYEAISIVEGPLFVVGVSDRMMWLTAAAPVIRCPPLLLRVAVTVILWKSVCVSRFSESLARCTCHHESPR